MNLRPSGYEPDELPGCSTPRRSEDGRQGRHGGVPGRFAPVRRLFGRGRSGGRTGTPVLRPVGRPFFAGLATTYSPMSLRQSTIGAEAFDGRVRDGIGSFSPRNGHQAGKERSSDDGGSEDGYPSSDPPAVFRQKQNWFFKATGEEEDGGRKAVPPSVCSPSSVIRIAPRR